MKLRPRPLVSEYFWICNFFFPDSKISLSTRYRIRCGFIIFHSEERIKKYPDSLNACERKQYPERKSYGLKNIRISVDGALASEYRHWHCTRIPVWGLEESVSSEPSVNHTWLPRLGIECEHSLRKSHVNLSEPSVNSRLHTDSVKCLLFGEL